MSDRELVDSVIQLLRERFGATETTRFIELVRKLPRDYAAWRDETFRGLTAEQLIEGLAKVDDGK